VNKIPPNFDTQFAVTIVAVQLFKGLTVRPLYKPFCVKGLKSVLSYSYINIVTFSSLQL